jgi:hypothetical protein
MLAFLQTPKGIHIALDGKVRTISSEEATYEQILKAVKAGAPESEINEILEKELARVTAAVASLQERTITDDVKISGGQVLFRGEAIHNSTTDRILKMLDEGFRLEPMAAYLANLVQNPDARAVSDLYPFQEHGKMPITEDGCFLAYKAVRPDYMDIYTGTIDNSIGQRPKMLRFKVDDNPHQTCSSGLHVCSFDYLPHFSHANGHVMICKVNPKDVVAIPADYNNTKMRVSEYEVIGEYKDYYKEHPECLLSQISVATDSEPFSVKVFGSEGTKFSAFARLSQASLAAEEALTLPTTKSVQIVNITSGIELLSKENDMFEGFDDTESDDEDDRDEDEIEATGYDILYFDSEFEFDQDDGHEYATEIETLENAQRIALDLNTGKEPHAVQVRDQSGSVILTLIRG